MKSGPKSRCPVDQTIRSGHERYTNNPRTIRTRVSNGCARLTNHYIKDLYERVPMDTIVHLHPMQA